jgi:hypothetical protein
MARRLTGIAVSSVVSVVLRGILSIVFGGTIIRFCVALIMLVFILTIAVIIILLIILSSIIAVIRTSGPSG